MRFPGYWLEGTGADVTVQPYVFDDTELPEGSDWKEANQNDDPEHPHGFIDPIAMLREVCRRVLDAQPTEIDMPEYSGNAAAVAVVSVE